MVETIHRAVALADLEHPGQGAEFIALGSDVDGWGPVGFNASGWPLLTDGLFRAGLRSDEIARIMGIDACQLLLRTLPGESNPADLELCMLSGEQILRHATALQ